MRPLLLCTDLDRTLIPNGDAPESPDARPRFRRFVARDGVTLAYVSGRHRDLVREAIADYELPIPDLVVGDVGTRIFRVGGDDWEELPEWQARIGRDWAGSDWNRLAAGLSDVPGLRLQEADRQSPFKLSFYTPIEYTRSETSEDCLATEIRARLARLGVRAALVRSIDEAVGVGLLDVLPSGATKYHAVDYLMRRFGFDPTLTLFAGDSGNDLDVLVGPIPAVLVANADPALRTRAEHAAAAAGYGERLYCARGDWCGMNGHYGAGILEGIAHFRPDLFASPDPCNPDGPVEPTGDG